jgi:AcrR family transcriptional regulator
LTYIILGINYEIEVNFVSRGEHMPKFSEQEKSIINEDIINKSKELFSSLGLKKTSIDDIVQACGIGKGTFYSFFSSKEELFFAIAEREESFRDNLLKEMLESPKPPKESFKDFLLQCFNFIDKNAFLKKLGDRRELELLFRKLPKETIEAHFTKDAEASMQFIIKWQDEGIMKNEDPLILVGVLRALFMFVYFKEEIGPPDLYGKVVEKYIDYIVDGMFL